ncbi:photosynthetic reaction center cytochrome PufC [Falsiroseomonas selenitidurans]|uniref:Photosynthetic reaction center cytochrome c subunit n=1 Tax=Falsiroseomonas selenitidurans TaxID=2716335 RepID=A0ABX1E9Q5_9PROT|nr:photosynthetic reaction center cytochrome PufC [Falsiroseomonas selenitidurans]NKC33965.1 photosynthetic reaction center cytochrome c subunit [Falsiroseomonas selenitidurans]
MSLTARVGLAFAAALCVAIVLLTFERPPIQASQVGFRGTAMEQVVNPRSQAVRLAANRLPEAPEAAGTDGERAHEIYENVQVLREVSVEQFGRIMQAMTEWIAPEQGCTYCHNPENLASDEVYTKVVARRMLQMTAHINADWTPHVGTTGVTCYTCHRGRPVPAAVWANTTLAQNGLQAPNGQNHPSLVANLSSLPLNPFTPFLEQDNQIRVISTAAHPATNPAGIKEAEWTYSLMMHMSQALGVNCTFCHNSRSFANWSGSPPARLTAWHGIRMVRDLNNDYVTPLTPLWVANPHGPPDAPRVARLGPDGDALKVNCATCHQGANRPFYGAPMLQDYPELRAVSLGPTRVVIPQ